MYGELELDLQLLTRLTRFKEVQRFAHSLGWVAAMEPNIAS
jgi:hypothetical protein